MKWINRLYIFFLGIVLTITAGFGVAAFYPEPQAPMYPSTAAAPIVPQSCYATPQSQATPDCQAAFAKQTESQQQQDAQLREYDKKQQVFRNTNASYTRTAIFLGIVIGVILAMVGMSFLKISRLVTNGLLLAGVLTALLTRVLISLASLGAGVTGTNGADNASYLEFGVLLVLSIVIVVVGVVSFKPESNNSAK